MTAFEAVRQDWHGLACTLITLSNGDSVRISDYGAQVLSWKARGQERLFLSPRAVLDGSAAIRGGVPVCFPQFNVRGPLPKHGIARRTVWQWQGAQLYGDEVTASWHWSTSADVHVDFPYEVLAKLVVKVLPDRLSITLAVTNTGSTAFAFTAALHTYLAVQGAGLAVLNGLEGASYWDAAKNFAPAVQIGAITLGQEIDRVYAQPGRPLELHDATGLLHIHQDSAWSETVVWNPGPAASQSLPDMQAADWMRMLCVEAAAINQPVALHPGAHWQATQTLAVQG